MKIIGTTLIIVSQTVVTALYKSIHGAVFDDMSQLWSVPCKHLASLPNFGFTIGGKSFTLSPTEYTVPTWEDGDWSVTPNTCVSYIVGQQIYDGIDIIIGQKFLERYVSIYDSDGGRVGMYYNSIILCELRSAHELPLTLQLLLPPA